MINYMFDIPCVRFHPLSLDVVLLVDCPVPPTTEMLSVSFIPAESRLSLYDDIGVLFLKVRLIFIDVPLLSCVWIDLH